MKTEAKLHLLIFASILTMMSSLVGVAQKRVGIELLEAKHEKRVFKQLDDAFLENRVYNHANKSAFKAYYTYGLETFKKLNSNDTEYVSIPIHTIDGEYWILDLKKSPYKNVITSSTKNSTQLFNLRKKTSFRGVVRGKEKESLVCLIFTQEAVKGFISIRGEGVFEVNKLKESDTHILYNSKDQDQFLPDFLCGTDDNVNNDYEESIKIKSTSLSFIDRPCIGIQAVVDYNIFSGQGESDLVKTVNYVDDFYTLVFAIFYNESIDMTLNDVFIHTTEQEYTSPLGFVTQDDSYIRKGDLIQFLRDTSYGGRSGAATTGSICDTYGYSWGRLSDGGSVNVKTVAHELGHNLGSPHTFDCNWNSDVNYTSGDNNPTGDNRITNCAADDGCTDYAGPDPRTVMGYCGGNLEFSPQAGDLLRMIIDSCPNDIITGCTGVALSSLENQAEHNDAIVIHPNPVSEILKIEGISKNDEILLMELTGKVLERIVGKGEINMSELSTGLYLLVIKSKDKVSIKRVLRK